MQQDDGGSCPAPNVVERRAVYVRGAGDEPFPKRLYRRIDWLLCRQAAEIPAQAIERTTASVFVRLHRMVMTCQTSPSKPRSE